MAAPLMRWRAFKLLRYPQHNEANPPAFNLKKCASGLLPRGGDRILGGALDTVRCILSNGANIGG
jgi:hypothetical protein